MSEGINSEDIADFVDVLQADGAHTIIKYGSSLTTSNPGDVDLVAIFPDRGAGDHFELGPYDVIRLSEDRWEQYVKQLDPVYATEPLLTGEFLKEGPNVDPDRIRNDVKESTPTDSTRRYLLTEAMTHYTQAKTYRKRGHDQTAISSLSFAVSYLRVAEWYAAGNEPAPYASIRDRLPDAGRGTLSKIEDRLSGTPQSADSVDELLDLYADHLIRLLL